MIDKTKKYALIGASADKEKYGFKILKDLKEGGYKVIPVNLRGGKILGLNVYPTLLEVPQKIDVAIFVVPPSVTEEILITVKKLRIYKVWLQPGSESQKAIEFCKQNNIECTHNVCIMIQKNK
jgi:hypothetical protein